MDPALTEFATLLSTCNLFVTLHFVDMQFYFFACNYLLSARTSERMAIFLLQKMKRKALPFYLYKRWGSHSSYTEDGAMEDEKHRRFPYTKVGAEILNVLKPIFTRLQSLLCTSYLVFVVYNSSSA